MPQNLYNGLCGFDNSSDVEVSKGLIRQAGFYFKRCTTPQRCLWNGSYHQLINLIYRVKSKMVKMRNGTHIKLWTVILFLGMVLPACGPTVTPAAEEIVLYNWEGDIPASVLEGFTARYGIRVRYEVYESQEEAIENMRSGREYDVVVMESRFLPMLAEEKLLAKLNYENIVNFKNISPNFRDLIYDPGNQYSVPYSWGLTALVVQTDQVSKPVTRWTDMWDPDYAGRVAIWYGQPRETLAFVLKSLGYSANSENPAELEQALARLVELKPHLRYVEDYDSEIAVPAFQEGGIALLAGYSGDYLASREAGLQVQFVTPEEGALIWGDVFIVPARSAHQAAAEIFINYLLLPDVSAQIVNQKYYASANEAARNFIEPQILQEPSIYPADSVLEQAEILLPLSREGQRLYDDIWRRFLSASPEN